MVSHDNHEFVRLGSRRFGGPIQFRDIWPVLREDLRREALPPGSAGGSAGAADGALDE